MPVSSSSIRMPSWATASIMLFCARDRRGRSRAGPPARARRAARARAGGREQLPHDRRLADPLHHLAERARPRSGAISGRAAGIRTVVAAFACRASHRPVKRSTMPAQNSDGSALHRIRGSPLRSRQRMDWPEGSPVLQGSALSVPGRGAALRSLCSSRVKRGAESAAPHSSLIASQRRYVNSRWAPRASRPCRLAQVRALRAANE